MAKKAKGIPEWVVGLLVTAVVLILVFMNVGLLEVIELKTYDARLKLAAKSFERGDEVRIVAIDEDSIMKLGRWPWSRSRIAEIIKVLKESGAKIIGLNILFSEPDENQGLVEIKNLRQYVRSSRLLKLKIESKAARGRIWSLYQRIKNAQLRLDNDAKLVGAVTESGNTVLPMSFTLGAPISEVVTPDFLLPQSVQNVFTSPDLIFYPVVAKKVTCPIPKLVKGAKSVGHINLLADADGSIRNEVLLIKYGDAYYPSFALQLVASYLGVGPEAINVNLGRNIEIGTASIPIDGASMLIAYSGPNKTYPYSSFYDVLNRKVDPALFRDKIVIVGHTSPGIVSLSVTPVSSSLPGVEIIANVVDNLLSSRAIVRPQWATYMELGLALFFGLYISFALPRLKAKMGAIITFLLFAGYLSFSTYSFLADSAWIKIVYPLLVLLGGYIIIISKRFLITERAKELVETDSIETNKMLGLSFQGQGMLDLAFEKFRKCPVDDPMKDILYNLALDYERKRMFNKAVAIYEHVSRADSKFKDIQDRIKRLKTAGETIVFGGGGGIKAASDSTVIVEGATEAPTLGRYTVEKELGRGAMGVVYLGRDPKINRLVAIKTIRLDEIEETERDGVKERFFREAESAGRLSHPNIVIIYDAGEEHDLAYIAMELLSGEDLVKYGRKDNLLPMKEVLGIVKDVASALDYAHGQNIVHRDIKPANIMRLEDDTIKVTDFGIARITTASKTQTGTVLGTPSYMSPEQLAGKKVDGRSDLFSLGVVLFELLTGEKPFAGESMATLMYKIANEPHPSPIEIKADIPECLKNIIDKALEKDVANRYQTGNEIIKDIEECLKTL